MPDLIWELDHVCLHGTHRPRLHDVDLAIGPGATAVVGASGAGKTSLLNVLVGFERPDRGRVRFGPPPDPRRLPLFWVPQDHGLWPHLTVRAHLETVGAADGVADREVMLAAFDLDTVADAHPDRISHGQRARLAMARALVADPVALVMDEPLVHVDPVRLDRCWEVIERQTRDRGTCVVFATHDPHAALTQARDVVCLDDGAVLYAGPVDALYRRPGSERLMRLLGDGNWLEPAEALRWLGRAAPEARCVRPQHLALRPDPEGPLAVCATRGAGPAASSELVHRASGARRRFWHSPRGAPLAPGTRVAIEVLTPLAFLLLLSLLLPACDHTDAELRPRLVRHWQIPASGPTMPAPRGVSIGPDDQVVVVDTAGRVLIFDADGTLQRQWRMPANEAGNPEGSCWLADGRIAIADTHYHRVVFFDQTGRVQDTLGGEPWSGADGTFGFPVSIVQDAAGHLYVAEYGGGDRIQKFTPDGRFVLAFGGPGTDPGRFQRAGGMVWRGGRIYIADTANGRIQVFHDDGRFIAVLGPADAPPTLRFPYDLDMGRDGRLYVIEWGAARITILDEAGRVQGRFGRPGSAAGRFHTPWGIAIDSADRVRVADTENRRIVAVEF